MGVGRGVGGGGGAADGMPQCFSNTRKRLKMRDRRLQLQALLVLQAARSVSAAALWTSRYASMAAD